MLLPALGSLTVNPLLVLFAALMVDAWLGDMPLLFRRIPHPIVLVGRAIAWFDTRLNRAQRSERARRARGIVTVLALIGAAAVVGLALEFLCRHSRYGWLIEIIVIAVLVAQRSLFDRVQAVA